MKLDLFPTDHFKLLFMNQQIIVQTMTFPTHSVFNYTKGKKISYTAHINLFTFKLDKSVLSIPQNTETCNSVTRK